MLLAMGASKSARVGTREPAASERSASDADGMNSLRWLVFSPGCRGWSVGSENRNLGRNLCQHDMNYAIPPKIALLLPGFALECSDVFFFSLLPFGFMKLAVLSAGMPPG